MRAGPAPRQVGDVTRCRPITTRTPRTGSITIGSQTFTVNTGGRRLHLSRFPRPAMSVVASGRHGLDKRDRGRRVCVDRAQQRQLDHGDERGERQRERAGWLQRGGQPDYVGAHRTLTIANRTFTVNAGRRGLHLLAGANQPGRRFARGGSTTTDVTTAPGCAGPAVSNATAWLAITNGASGLATARSRSARPRTRLRRSASEPLPSPARRSP